MSSTKPTTKKKSSSSSTFKSKKLQKTPLRRDIVFESMSSDSDSDYAAVKAL